MNLNLIAAANVNVHKHEFHKKYDTSHPRTVFVKEKIKGKVA